MICKTDFSLCAGLYMLLIRLKHLQLTCFLLLFCVLVGCTPPVTVPIEKLEYGSMAADHNKNLLILLRGIGGSHHDFEELGVVTEIRRLKLPFDIVVPNAHFGYYKNRTLVDRLYQDIIEPAQRQGYQNIWLAGFSMGGMGSLLYIRERPQDVNGILLISPFLGWDGMIHEIQKAGGISKWQTGTIVDEDWERILWGWIKKYSETPDLYPPLYLGFGRQDWVVDEGPPLLATILEKERVLTVDGRHDNETLMRIFYRQLEALAPLFRRLHVR